MYSSLRQVPGVGKAIVGNNLGDRVFSFQEHQSLPVFSCFTCYKVKITTQFSEDSAASREI